MQRTVSSPESQNAHTLHIPVVCLCCPYTLTGSHILFRLAIEQEWVVLLLLCEHCLTHQFLGPCCLCPLFEAYGQWVFTEAAMFIAMAGPYSGEYVVQCAKGECGYSGGSLVLFCDHAGSHGTGTYQYSSNGYILRLGWLSRHTHYKVIFSHDLWHLPATELMDIEDAAKDWPPLVLHHSELGFKLETQHSQSSMHWCLISISYHWQLARPPSTPEAAQENICTSRKVI